MIIYVQAFKARDTARTRGEAEGRGGHTSHDGRRAAGKLYRGRGIGQIG